MAKSTWEQIKELIDQSKKILITTKSRYEGDGLASALALASALKKMGKNSDIIIDRFKPKAAYLFLDNLKEVKAETEKPKKFIINLDISQTGINELSYDVQGDNLKIYLSPQRGVFTPSDLKFETSQFVYDLVFVLNAPDLESLGKLYDDHRDLFYQLPVINIDNSPENEQYGHINLINITATSTAEILYNLISQWPDGLIDQPLANLLLTGIIDATNCFKTPNVTPNALQIVSQMIDLGADRQKIISALYQTKTISTLKLWGKVLSRLQGDKNAKLLWSKISKQDFEESGAGENDIGGVIDELIASSPTVKIFLLFWEKSENEVRVIARSMSTPNIFELTRGFLPQGDKREVNFEIKQSLAEAEKQVIQALAEQLK